MSPTADLLFIRHAMSFYNYQFMKTKEEFGLKSDQMTELKKDQSYIDTELHPIGELQCAANKHVVHCIDAKYVLVSPMRRAL